MKLRTYLDAHEIPAHVFAAQIGVSPSSVYKYRTGTRKKPSRWVMIKIEKLTQGRVTIKDWQ